jgi:hypothetical protein
MLAGGGSFGWGVEGIGRVPLNLLSFSIVSKCASMCDYSPRGPAGHVPSASSSGWRKGCDGEDSLYYRSCNARSPALGQSSDSGSISSGHKIAVTICGDCHEDPASARKHDPRAIERF